MLVIVHPRGRPRNRRTPGLDIGMATFRHPESCHTWCVVSLDGPRTAASSQDLDDASRLARSRGSTEARVPGLATDQLYNNAMAAPQRLIDTPKRTTSVCWPIAVDDRLDRLHQLAREAGEQTSRAQILAALVAQAPLDGEGLGVLIRAYRRLPAAEFEAATGPMPEVARQPGPRPPADVGRARDPR